jgi:hypothetical protein
MTIPCYTYVNSLCSTFDSNKLMTCLFLSSLDLFRCVWLISITSVRTMIFCHTRKVHPKKTNNVLWRFNIYIYIYIYMLHIWSGVI